MPGVAPALPIGRDAWYFPSELYSSTRRELWQRSACPLPQQEGMHSHAHMYQEAVPPSRCGTSVPRRSSLSLPGARERPLVLRARGLAHHPQAAAWSREGSVQRVDNPYLHVSSPACPTTVPGSSTSNEFMAITRDYARLPRPGEPPETVHTLTLLGAGVPPVRRFFLGFLVDPPGHQASGPAGCGGTEPSLFGVRSTAHLGQGNGGRGAFSDGPCFRFSRRFAASRSALALLSCSPCAFTRASTSACACSALARDPSDSPAIARACLVTSRASASSVRRALVGLTDRLLTVTQIPIDA